MSDTPTLTTDHMPEIRRSSDEIRGMEEHISRYEAMIRNIRKARSKLVARRTQKPPEQATDMVAEAMRLLLSGRQIKFVSSRTFTGPSRKEIIRNLVERGIKDWKRERAAHAGE